MYVGLYATKAIKFETLLWMVNHSLLWTPLDAKEHAHGSYYGKSRVFMHLLLVISSG